MPVFVVNLKPRLQSIHTVGAKHWRSMVTQDQYLAKCFPEPPQTANRRPINIREFLLRAEVPPVPEQRQQRNIKEMQKCRNQCNANKHGKSLEA